ncbi:hypothetical protein J6590_064320 [Homalodisca vitripennis]|nr:hypothetical protein J6590_064320 [Homalodisca vitripennis]
MLRAPHVFCSSPDACRRQRTVTPPLQGASLQNIGPRPPFVMLLAILHAFTTACVCQPFVACGVVLHKVCMSSYLFCGKTTGLLSRFKRFYTEKDSKVFVTVCWKQAARECCTQFSQQIGRTKPDPVVEWHERTKTWHGARYVIQSSATSLHTPSLLRGAGFSWRLTQDGHVQIWDLLRKSYATTPWSVKAAGRLSSIEERKDGPAERERALTCEPEGREGGQGHGSGRK